ncbi:hypothetical protein RQP46_005454 [Phenoliferia psychrophenolica]
MAFQAWSYTSPPFPSTFALVPVTPPSELKETQVLIEVAAAGLNPVDVQLANAGIFKLAALSYPKGLGADFSGRVVAKGSAVSFDVGDEVFGLCFEALGKPMETCLSQILLADVTKAAILRKPPTMSHIEAAGVPLVFLTAATTLSEPYTILPPTTSTKPTIVILGGSSAVGIFAIQYAVRKLGARVIATCSSRNADFVKSLGAEVTIDYTKESVRDRLLTLRPAEGYVSVVDCVGGVDLISDSTVFSALMTPRSPEFKAGGAYITIVGDKTDRATMGGAILYFFSPRMLLRRFWGRWGSSPRYAAVNLRPDAALLEEAVKLREEGMVIPIDSTFPFDDALKAYENTLSDVTKALAEHGLLGTAPWPPASWTPTKELKVYFNEAEAALGNKFEPELAKADPTLFFKADAGRTYTIICVDPDAPSREDPHASPLNHWVLSGLRKDEENEDDDEAVTTSEEALVEYAGPSLKKFGHRYVFLLYQNSGPLLPLSQQSTIKDGKEISDRFKWDFETFTRENKLELVGAKWVLVPS